MTWRKELPTIEARVSHADFAEFLHERGWGYGRIARELGYSKTTIQDWLTGRRLQQARIDAEAAQTRKGKVI